jgi:cyclophilin family peptidyl-prolyl cis-trans isomerase
LDGPRLACPMRTTALVLVSCLLVGMVLAGCTKPDDDLVDNACTQHPKYGTGNPLVTLNTTHGDIVAEIFVDKVPNTGMNFVKLAESGVLDGSPFHRIISNFMMQGGDFTNRNGTGGVAAGDCANSEGNIPDEFREDLRHDQKGMLSMANAGAGTASSQFFITFVATPWLDAYNEDGTMKDCSAPRVSCHAVFGKVVEGMDVLDRVNSEAASSSGQPRVPVTLLKATVAWPS